MLQKEKLDCVSKNNSLYYKICSDHPRLLGLIPSIYAVTHGLIGMGYGFAMRRLNLLYSDKLGFAKFCDGSLFYFRLGDDYWNRLALAHFNHEPELAELLSRLKETDYVFLDAGANFGYWSVLASSTMFGEKRAIAIEASSETFKFLEFNQTRNNNRFSIHNNAVFNEDGRVLSFSSGAHAGRHVDPLSATGCELITSISLDGLVRDYQLPVNERIVLKLDVEGSEVEALEGARNLLNRDVLLIYEEHGKDQYHRTTRHLQKYSDRSIFYIDMNSTEWHVEQIHTDTCLDKIKQNPVIGYNFVSCKSDSDFYKILASEIAR